MKRLDFRFYATESTSSRWLSISELLLGIEVAMAVAVADDDALSPVDSFKGADEPGIINSRFMEPLAEIISGWTVGDGD